MPWIAQLELESLIKVFMILRLVSTLVLVPAVLVLVIYGSPFFFLIAVGIVGTACLYEFSLIARAMGASCQPWFCYPAFWILLTALSQKLFPAAAVLAIVLLVAFLAGMWRTGSMKDRVLGLMAGMLGVLYLSLLLSTAISVRFDFGNDLGVHWLIVLLVVTWVGDTAAFFIGRRCGRHPFAPVLSPKKTNEGAIAGLLAGAAAAVILQRVLFTNLPLIHVIAASLLIGMFGQLGDLAESMLKRAADIKDSSRFIPGHGGILDRVDSLLFSFPILYLYLLWLYPSP
ncbi:MAG: phosphatidate cytidylyltransferase [Acidobacteria bacterium]|nr:phosphatidate cytidylyltransferase [Acidobacteriota bacterium]